MMWTNEFRRMVFKTFLKDKGFVGLLIDPNIKGVCLPDPFTGQDRVLIHLGDGHKIFIGPDRESVVETNLVNLR